DHHALADPGAAQRRAQLLQRPARPAVHRHLRRGRRVRDPPLRLARRAPRRGVGLRLSRSQPDHAIRCRQLRPADPTRVRHAGVPGARGGRHAAAGRPPPRTASCAPDRSGVGGHLRAGRGRGRLRRGSPDPPAVPDHPPLPGAGVLRLDLPPSGAGGMALIQALLVQGAQMALVLILAPLLTGLVRKIKARLLRRRGPSLVQPYRDLLRFMRKEVVLAENASWLFRSAPYLIFAATWVAAALVPTFASGLLFS